MRRTSSVYMAELRKKIKLLFFMKLKILPIDDLSHTERLMCACVLSHFRLV